MGNTEYQPVWTTDRWPPLSFFVVALWPKLARIHPLAAPSEAWWADGSWWGMMWGCEIYVMCIPTAQVIGKQPRSKRGHHGSSLCHNPYLIDPHVEPWYTMVMNPSYEAPGPALTVMAECWQLPELGQLNGWNQPGFTWRLLTFPAGLVSNHQRLHDSLVVTHGTDVE